ncbi:unnamed protein product [Paramecium octaurelia]|uniref:Uncharacterized protein n=1 Tax=Paramecium octaurelia TaxID=43137 RepID=A0A8S1U324_PAROT|nr:unnamed protein product [Paramecium octaurelia]
MRMLMFKLITKSNLEQLDAKFAEFKRQHNKFNVELTAQSETQIRPK